MSADQEELFGDQEQMLTGVGPQLGDTFRNVHTGDITVILGVRRGRRTWIKARRNGRVTEMTLEMLQEHYRPFRFGSAGL